MSASYIVQAAINARDSRRLVMPVRLLVWFLAFAALWTSVAMSDARAATPAEAFVQSSIEKSYAILNDPESNAAERELQFRALLLSIVDVKRIALFTLGP